MFALVTLSLACSDDGEADATPGGAVSSGNELQVSKNGVPFGSVKDTYAVVRRPKSQLNASDFPAVDIYLGAEGALANFCPDIGMRKGNQSWAKIYLQANPISPGDYPICTSFDCPGPSAKVNVSINEDVGFGTEASAGTVTLTEAGGRYRGTLQVTVGGELVIGQFNVAKTCDDPR